jgi:hypothetical protein
MLRVTGLGMALLLMAGCSGPEPPLSEGERAVAADPGVRSTVEDLLGAALSERLGVAASARIDRFADSNGWILTCGQPLGPAGEAIDYSRTTLREQQAAGMVDDQFCALLQEVATGVQILELSVGDTDAPFMDWPGKHGVPESLLYE